MISRFRLPLWCNALAFPSLLLAFSLTSSAADLAPSADVPFRALIVKYDPLWLHIHLENGSRSYDLIELRITHPPSHQGRVFEMILNSRDQKKWNRVNSEVHFLMSPVIFDREVERDRQRMEEENRPLRLAPSQLKNPIIKDLNP